MDGAKDEKERIARKRRRPGSMIIVLVLLLSIAVSLLLAGREPEESGPHRFLCANRAEPCVIPSHLSYQSLWWPR